MRRLHNEAILTSGEVIKTALTKAEDSIDQAIADIGSLAAAISTERVRCGVAPQFGREAVTLGAEGMALLAAGRAKIIEAHDELAKTSRSLGVPPRAFDGLYGKPAKALELHVVEAKAA